MRDLALFTFWTAVAAICAVVFLTSAFLIGMMIIAIFNFA